MASPKSEKLTIKQCNVTTETLQAVGRLRRAQPRNPDTMLVCDAIERALTAMPQVAKIDPSSIELKPGPIQFIQNDECPVCEARKFADRARVQKHRKRQAKAAA